MSQSAMSGLPTIRLISSRLLSMVDIVKYRVMVPNLIWFNTVAIKDSRFIETLKYGMLEVQEHLETFCDKKEQASMFCDAVKTTLKLERLSGQQSEFHNEQYLLDLGKALYKLYFQLLLLIEVGNKMVANLHSSLKSADDPNDKTKPEDLRIVDWQISSFGSPCADLAYFLLVNSSEEVLDDIQTYLKIYYDKLSSQLRKFNLDSDELFPFSTFQGHLNLFLLQSFYYAFLLFKVMLSDKEDIPDHVEAVDKSGDAWSMLSYETKNFE
uniref:Uncharacterized protein LOC114338721 n=1 Tax=Diabrotica virgifera virgifera TaxID=50390 RepID=A0A6P7GMV8_DIAVI